MQIRIRLTIVLAAIQLGPFVIVVCTDPSLDRMTENILIRVVFASCQAVR